LVDALLSGGVIQNIALNAAYLARARGLPRVDSGSLKTALARELAKLGRLVHETGK
jgi:hypothetical protein